MDVKKDSLNYDSDTELEDAVFDEADSEILDVASLEGVYENERAQKRDKPFASIDRQKLIKTIATGLFWTLVAYLLGAAELPFGAIPFGIALLCAASSKLAYIYAGLCLSAFVGREGALVYFCTYTAIVFVRVLSRILIDNPFSDENDVSEEDRPQTIGDLFPIIFSEHIFLRMATSCIGAFIIGIYSLTVGGFLFYDLWGTLVSMIAAPICVYLFCGLSGSGGALGIDLPSFSAHVSEGRHFAAVCALSASVILALRDVTVLGMSLSLFGAMLITLYFSRKNGIMHSLVAGTLAGLACSPMLAPIFAFAAISSGALWKVSTFFACLSACSIGLAWGLYAEGISALTTVLPAILSSALIFAVFEKLYLADKFSENEEVDATPNTESVRQSSKAAQVCKALGEDSLNTVVLGDTEQRINAICETFSSLSTLFYSLSEKMRTPSSADLKQICDNAFDSCCHSCELRSVCWENEYSSSLSALGKLCSALGQNGRVCTDDVSSRMLERCSAMPEIINQINRNSMMHTQQLIIGDKTEIFALDYEAISDLLAATITAQRSQFEYKAELSEVARELILDRDFPITAVFSYGNERSNSFVLLFENKKAMSARKDEIVLAFEELCSERLECTVDLEGGKMTLTSAQKYKIEHAKRSVKAEGEEGFCGDTVSIFESGKDRFYSFISDGMGSGREAALTSGICSVFLSNLLRATNKCDLSLGMLNGFLRNKGSGSMHECSATVDLLELDLITGKAQFYKGGAAPSYIYRDGNLFKLRSNTVPLGIIKELDTKKISIDLTEGDLIVMVSDGVTQSKEECPWLFDLLKANVGKESLASIADMIVKRAKYEGASDDISVVVMKVDQAA